MLLYSRILCGSIACKVQWQAAALTVLMGAIPSEPERLSGADPGTDPDPPSELLDGPAASPVACPSLPLRTDLHAQCCSGAALAFVPAFLS